MNQTARNTSIASFNRVCEWVRSRIEALTRGARIGWPVADLMARPWLAQSFFFSGVLKIANWETALDLAAHEYPVSWMNPVAAAYAGASIELVGSILLSFGFMTRYAATSMFVLSLVIQFNYHPLDSQLFGAALFGWYMVSGAGALSIDGSIRRGLGDSALPIVPRIVRASQWVRAKLTPYYLTVIRVWWGSALIATGAATSTVWSPLWLPTDTAHTYAAAFAIGAGILLAMGLATRVIALMLVIAALGALMVEGHTDVAQIIFLGLLVLQGGGALAVDRVIHRTIARRAVSHRERADATDLPKVVIVGAGFGGLTCANALRNAAVSVTLIDRANYHLFQPLLYQVATAGLSPSDIAAPVRPLFRDARNTRVLFGTVTGVDTEKRTVRLGGRDIAYDYLVLATGAAHSYFGKDQWAAVAPGLKRVEDATEIRRKLLTAFEQAEVTEDIEERKALLTFLIVGGGPTGVELAGAIAELARFGMAKEFRSFDPSQARVVLVQSGARLLPAFPESLAAIAQRSLESLGVEVVLGSRVENIDADGVTVSGKRIVSRQVLWAAGVAASPAAKWLKATGDSAGRVKVNADLSVPGLGNVFAIGDTALSNAWNGQPVPGLAPAAKQGGKYVAEVIRARITHRPGPSAFVYRHLGSLATIGRKSAVADFGFIKLWGAPAWWLWGFVHVGFLVGIRNRLSTMVNWFWSYLTYGGGIRLITGSPSAPGNYEQASQPRFEAPLTKMRNAS
jgi:NADH dehydrogenase FAD-containing subunit/uncharacterized membrane protein YphA (DoxX/SURF4 family)